MKAHAIIRLSKGFMERGFHKFNMYFLEENEPPELHVQVNKKKVHPAKSSASKLGCMGLPRERGLTEN